MNASIGDSRPSPVGGKGKIFLKLTLRKILSLNDVFHILDICWNLFLVSLLNKMEVWVTFESDKIVMIKEGKFVGKGYCNQSLFMLSVFEIMNENASSS